MENEEWNKLREKDDMLMVIFLLQLVTLAVSIAAYSRTL